MGKKNKDKDESGQIDIEPVESKKVKKKHKVKSDPIIDAEETKEDEPENSHEVTGNRKEKKKKKKKNKATEDQEVNCVEKDGKGEIKAESSAWEDTIDESPKKKSKKKKHKKDKEKVVTEVEPNTLKTDTINQTEEIVLKKKKSNGKCKDIVIENKYVVDENDNVPKKKKKKRKHQETEDFTMDNATDTSNELVIKKKRKSITQSDDSECSEKLLAIEPEENTATSNGKNKQKRKKEKHSEKTGEKEATSINTPSKDKKKRNKDERANRGIEKDEIQPKKVKKEEYSSVKVGQWGTAEFESSERQSKFLKLLGGMKNKTNGPNENNGKKGLFGGLAALAAKTGNSAMSSHEENKWATNMESQFDKALGYKAKRGGGLGFEKPPEEGKKFHIHIDKSNSIKFDD